MESELAKTLRSMSDDHRMVPDFSEQLLDIADAIERQAKELAHKKSAYDYAYEKWADAAKERDAARAEVERLKGELGTAREASDRVIEHLNGRIEELQGQIELWKDMTGKARIETALRGTVGR